MKEVYISPEIIIMNFATADIITTSDWNTEDELPDDYK